MGRHLFAVKEGGLALLLHGKDKVSQEVIVVPAYLRKRMFKSSSSRLLSIRFMMSETWYIGTLHETFVNIYINR